MKKSRFVAFVIVGLTHLMSTAMITASSGALYDVYINITVWGILFLMGFGYMYYVSLTED